MSSDGTRNIKSQMKVLKFGGTSVGSAPRMKAVASIINDTVGKKVVVLSAVSGTTNSLVEICQLHAQNEAEQVAAKIASLRTHYGQILSELFSNSESHAAGEEVVNRYFDEISKWTSETYSAKTDKMVVVIGELISTNLFSLHMKDIKSSAALLPAVNFMCLNEEGEPDVPAIQEKLEAILAQHEEVDTFITQGFICRNSAGEVDNLKRGGSDYSATLIGSALKAAEVQIWTDIDGMHNNDPRVVDQTRPISNLSFEEAAELAYFGAKILHPTCIIPAQIHNVPVRIKNTMKPDAGGTLITSEKDPQGVKAIAAKGKITAIKIKSSRMIMAYGFLRKVFEVFEKYKTPIDMITTSEIAVSLTVDDDSSLPEIVKELEPYGAIEVDQDQTIICIVGDLIAEQKGLGGKIFNVLNEIPIRMISFGGSKNNVSILVDSQFKASALQALNQGLFKWQ